MTVSFIRILILLLSAAFICLLVMIILKQDRLIFPGWIDDSGENKGPGVKTHRPPDIAFHFLRTPTGSDVEVWAMHSHCDSHEDPPPLAFIFGGNGSRIEHAYPKMSFFKDLCIDSIALEYSGFGRSTGAPGEDVIYRDVDTLLNFAESEFSDFDRRKIVILGNSLGGGAATYLASILQPQSLILTSSFSSLPDAAADRSFLYRLLKPFIRHVFPNRRRLEELSNSCVILAHDTDDNIVSFNNLSRLTLAAKQSNRVHNIITTGHGHNVFSAIEPELNRLLRICLNE